MRNLIRAISGAALAALLFATPACATSLLAKTITTFNTAAVTTAVQLRDGAPLNLSIQCNFTYGSSGTSADAWVQTSLDGGTTWIDIAECGFTTSSVRKLYNLSSLTPVTTVYTATDGSLTANTAKDGVLGNWMRVKYTTVGTYATSTTLNIDISTRSRVQ